MPYPVYIGDEADAAGFRLAGVRVYSPPVSELTATLHTVASDASLILLGTRLAGRLPAGELQRLQAAVDPPLVVIGDPAGGAPTDDLAERLRRELGMLE